MKKSREQNSPEHQPGAQAKAASPDPEVQPQEGHRHEAPRHESHRREQRADPVGKEHTRHSGQDGDGFGRDAAAPSPESSGGNGRPAVGVDVPALQAQLEAKDREARENRDQYVRTIAEMDNVRKRYQREKEEATAYANSGLVLRLLPILDNFELAIKHSESSRDFEGLLQGVNQIFRQMRDTLEKEGVEPIRAVGQPFNPDEHEALGRVPSDEYPDGTVAQDLRTGYRMKGRCIRPSLVRVAGE